MAVAMAMNTNSYGHNHSVALFGVFSEAQTLREGYSSWVSLQEIKLPREVFGRARRILDGAISFCVGR